jgi:predicted MPP superfamily phosphohydrolase
MRRMLRVLLIGMSVLGAAHFYIWMRLVHDPQLPSAVYVALSAWFVLGWLSLPLTFILGRRLSERAALLITWPGYVWLGTLFLLLVAVLGVDVLRGVIALATAASGASLPMDAGRQLAHQRTWAALAGGVGGAAALLSLWLGRRVVVKRVEVPLARLPAGLHGTNIVQLSDVHIGPTLGRRFLSRVVDKVNALQPEVVVITGDLVDGSVERLGPAVAVLARLRARHGVFFVTGNHEYYSGADAWCTFLTGLGVRVLRNERVAIGAGAQSYDLAGVDDFSAHHFGGDHGADLSRALAGRDASRELILLAHQPRAVVDAERAGVGLQISGHTHGGQIWPFNYLVRLQQPVTSGLVRFGRSLIYVSNGTGYWGPPMRLGSPAEITQLVLHRAGKNGTPEVVA